ncbi:hypothetical protein V5O48_017547 [Marasmius crinis-equi]|uniref:Amidohydrolase-related domain-containing protein n=1 Tax=Marasmius crinis-equi TaxID=585013 RepID=A0ABR3ENM8_9AGAR
MPASLLLRNGTALLHDDNDKVTPTRTDILVEDNVISRIEKDIVAPPGTGVIDCTNKIISPGFIDGHQHVWQTFNKGRHANETLLEYMPTGAFTANLHTREDIYWGQLGGCLSLLNAGTTTVLDHAHLNVFSGSSEVAISATVSSGIRSLFCYTPSVVVTSWSPFDIHPNILEPWVISDLAALLRKAPFGSQGRVRLGLGFDAWYLPSQVFQPLFDVAQKGGIDLLTSHMVGGPMFPIPNLVEAVQRSGALNGEVFRRVVLSHATGITPDQADVLVESDAYIVSTPSTELQMGHGRPVCFDENIRSNACLGGDCLSSGGFSIPGEMRLGLQAERGLRNQKIIDKNKAIKHVHRTVEQAFNLGTIQGARAIGMEEKIGSIAVGKLADLVVFDGDTPAMICAAQNDPVAAIVLFSTSSDISTVIIDGVLRKSEGRLCPVQVEDGAKGFIGKDIVEWRDIGKHILEMRDEYWNNKSSKIDFKEAEKGVSKAWHIDESKFTDEA